MSVVINPIHERPIVPEKFEPFRGIAFASILAVPFALSLMKAHIDPSTAILYWLVFVVLAGISVDAEHFQSLRELGGYCFIPGLVLVLVMTFRGALDYISQAALLTVGTFSSVPNDAAWRVKIGLLYLFVFVATGPAIGMASLARPLFLSVGTSVWNAEPAKVKVLEKNIVAILRIVGLLVAGVIAFR